MNRNDEHVPPVPDEIDKDLHAAWEHLILADRELSLATGYLYRAALTADNQQSSLRGEPRFQLIVLYGICHELTETARQILHRVHRLYKTKAGFPDPTHYSAKHDWQFRIGDYPSPIRDWREREREAEIERGE